MSSRRCFGVSATGARPPLIFFETDMLASFVKGQSLSSHTTTHVETEVPASDAQCCCCQGDDAPTWYRLTIIDFKVRSGTSQRHSHTHTHARREL
jgi:hypothetical protein